MSEYTPGDWYAYRSEHPTGECYRIEIRGNPYRMNGKVVASEPVCTLHWGFVHFEGNARLLLAAPDLHKACLDAAVWMESQAAYYEGIGWHPEAHDYAVQADKLRETLTRVSLK